MIQRRCFSSGCKPMTGACAGRMRKGDRTRGAYEGDNKKPQQKQSVDEGDRLPEDVLLGQWRRFSWILLPGFFAHCFLVRRSSLPAYTPRQAPLHGPSIEPLAKHPEVHWQDKLRHELLEAIREYGANIPYDVLVMLPYMDTI